MRYRVLSAGRFRSNDAYVIQIAYICTPVTADYVPPLLFDSIL